MLSELGLQASNRESTVHMFLEEDLILLLPLIQL
jgi:hypothetical protein